MEQGRQNLEPYCIVEPELNAQLTAQARKHIYLSDARCIDQREHCKKHRPITEFVKPLPAGILSDDATKKLVENQQKSTRKFA